MLQKYSSQELLFQNIVDKHFLIVHVYFTALFLLYIIIFTLVVVLS